MKDICEGADMKKQNKVEKGIVLDFIDNNIEAKIEDINEISAFISNLEDNKLDFTNETTIRFENENIGFISINKNEISEKEFLQIVEANKKRSYKKAGLYQQSLFERYLEAKSLQDDGYIKDIFEKALNFKQNLEKIKELKVNKAFKKEWNKNFGKITPESVLKRTGSMRLINVIENSVD